MTQRRRSGLDGKSYPEGRRFKIRIPKQLGDSTRLPNEAFGVIWSGGWKTPLSCVLAGQDELSLLKGLGCTLP